MSSLSPQLAWTQTQTRFMTWWKLSSSSVVQVVLVAQFSTTCTASSILVRLVYMVGHGGLYESCSLSSGTQELLNSFPATLLAFSNVVSDCMCPLPVCVSVNSACRATGSRVDWLLSFSKMTNTLRQWLFWG